MGALTQVYVDPAIAGDSGTGTLLDPYGDLQYALNTITRDATNGNQINIKAGTAEVLAASLTLATYGAPAEGAPLILRGYTAAANDGGQAEINCNGVTMWAANSYGYVNLKDLTIHTFGNNNGINCSGAGGYWLLDHCNIHKGASSPSGKSLIVGVGNRTRIIGCYVHDAGTTGIGIQNCHAYKNYVKDCPTGISAAGQAQANLVIDCATGISAGVDDQNIFENTIYIGTASTGSGISIGAGIADCSVLNNIIVGYSGTGGKGISASGDLAIIGYNAFYNNATNNSLADVYLDLTAFDAILAASPFTNAAGGDFSLNTAVVGAIETAYPGAWYGPASTTNKADMGAVQNGAGVGGAVSISPFRGNIG